MKADAHEQTARALEADIGVLRAHAGSPQAIIEIAWGAGFQWIAFGWHRKYQQHREKHEGLARYLEQLNEALISDYWREFETLRQQGFYGYYHGDTQVLQAVNLVANLRMWALS